MADRTRFNDGFESPRLPARPFVLIAAGMIVFLAVSLGGLWAAFTTSVPGRMAPAALSPPAARLPAPTEPDEAPIARAMAIIAARGADAYSPIDQPRSNP